MSILGNEKSKKAENVLLIHYTISFHLHMLNIKLNILLEYLNISKLKYLIKIEILKYFIMINGMKARILNTVTSLTILNLQS